MYAIRSYYAAIQAGATKYTSVIGTKALREAVQRKFRRDNGLDFPLDRIVVASGAKPLICRTCLRTT